MEALNKAYEAIELLKSLGLPVSHEQYAAISKIEKEYITQQILPLVKEELEPLLADLRNAYKIVLSYSPETGIQTDVEKKDEPVETEYTPRTKQHIIKVDFPDGHSACHRQVFKTLIDVVEYAGAEKVRTLNIQTITGNIISDELIDHKRYGIGQKRLSTGEYVQTYSNTENKFKQISEINKRLNLGLVVRKVPLSASFEDDGKNLHLSL